MSKSTDEITRKIEEDALRQHKSSRKWIAFDEKVAAIGGCVVAIMFFAMAIFLCVAILRWDGRPWFRVVDAPTEQKDKP